MDYNMYLCGKALVEKVDRNSSTVVEGDEGLRTYLRLNKSTC